MDDVVEVRMPPEFLPASLRAPASKSDAIRALVLADVCELAADRLGALHAQAGLLENNASSSDIEVVVAGLAALRSSSSSGGGVVRIDVRDAGAPFRILLAQAAVTPGGVVEFVGSPRLGERPVTELLEALRAGGATIERDARWPIVVRRSASTLRPRTMRIDASKSGQFFSALLLAAARVARREGADVQVEAVGTIASAGYVELTLQWLRRAGFDVRGVDSHFSVRWLAASSAAQWTLPADWSSISYLTLLAWACHGAVEDVPADAHHPDRSIIDVLRASGCNVALDASTNCLRVLGRPTCPVAFDARAAPDLVPTLVAWSPHFPGGLRVTHVDILRGKESDRVAGLETLVGAAGGRIDVRHNSIAVEWPHGGRRFAFGGQNDHRLVMAAACLAVALRQDARIGSATSVRKSFAAFWQELAKLGVSSVVT